MSTRVVSPSLARLAISVLAMGTIGATKCAFSSDPDLIDPTDPSPSGIVFHFSMRGDASGTMDFRAATEDPQVIAAVRAQLAKPVAERTLFIAGPIEHGNGGHNLVWRWHFVPDAWRLTEAAIELCDGNAVLVNQSVDHWVDVVGSFCPWDSYVAAEVGTEP
jgi:hypothetical protein